jgi:hypothetical protein
VALLALAAVAATGWTMGMIREARITYVLFPFVIPLALDLALSERARAAARAPVAWAAGLLVLAAGAVGIALLAADPEARIPALRAVIGENFNPGVLQVLEVPMDGETFLLEEPVFASRWSGPYVLLHAAASAFLLAGWWATRAPGSAPAADAPTTGAPAR